MRAQSAGRRGRGKQITALQFSDRQERIFPPRRRRRNRTPAVLRQEGMFGGNERRAAIERIQQPITQRHAFDPHHPVDRAIGAEHAIADPNAFDRLPGAVGEQDRRAADKTAIGMRRADAKVGEILQPADFQRRQRHGNGQDAARGQQPQPLCLVRRSAVTSPLLLHEFQGRQGRRARKPAAALCQLLMVRTIVGAMTAMGAVIVVGVMIGRVVLPAAPMPATGSGRRCPARV